MMNIAIWSLTRLIPPALLAYVIWSISRRNKKPYLRSVAILVLGDIGRSPRMMYHAGSFVKNGFQTYLIGYGGSTPIPSLERENVQIMFLSELPSAIKGLPFIILAPVKVFFQSTAILYTLLFHIPHPPEYIMVQNPPSVPTLILAQLVCWLRGSKLIIDWHNLGYSILALRRGERDILVRVYKWVEGYFGRDATVHLFVTKAMRDHLVKQWGLRGNTVVLHDRPPSYFKRAEILETHDLFNKLNSSLTSGSLTSFMPECSSPNATPFTRLTRSAITPTEVALDTEISYSFVSPSAPSATYPILRTDRPALLVSSTSWTPDEDFSILLDALRLYDKKAKLVNEGDSVDGIGLPKLMVIVTGKGPDKLRYMTQIARLEEEWRWVRCRSLWLEAEDYPILLGSADLGVSLHASSSALDLPMKIVDMFGCALPVCALDFKCIGELVQDGLNGFVFRTSDELATLLESLLAGFPCAPALDNLCSKFQTTMHSQERHSVRGERGDGWCSWEQNWDRVLKPHLIKDFEDNERSSIVSS